MENHYFDADGVYAGSAPANEGTLPPDCALRVAPPAREGHWPVLNAARDGWDLVEDHRGEKGWLDGSPATIHAPGPYPPGWQALQPGPAAATDPKALRKAAFQAEADPLRELALSYKAEAEALRLAGNAGEAERAEVKYRRELSAYLERKKEIRRRHPKGETEAPGETPATAATAGEPASVYLTRSGVYHRDGCIYTRAAGKWLSPAALRDRHPKAKPCGACHPGGEAEK